MKIQIIYAAVGIAVCVCLAYVNLSIPQCELSRGTEVALSAASMLTFFIIMLPLVLIGSIKRRKDKKYAAFVFAVFFIIAPTVMIGVQRVTQTQRNYWRFEGAISDKYISNNHGSKSLVVAGKEYEFIPEEIWNEAEIGGKIRKDVCSNIILNSTEFEFAP